MDALLLAAGWHVCNAADANIHASTGVAIREVETGVDTKLKRAQALRDVTLAKAFTPEVC